MHARYARIMIRKRVVMGVVLVAIGLAGVLARRGDAGAILLRTIPLNGSPNAILADALTRRAFMTLDDGPGVEVLDTRSGRVVRTVAAGTSPVLVAQDAAQGCVLVGDRWDNTLRVLDARTVRILRTVGLPGDAASGAAEVVQGATVDARAGRLFVAGSAGDTALTGHVNTYTATGARLLHTTPLGVAPYAALAVDEATAHIFVVSYRDAGGSNRGSVLMLDARSGRVMRAVPVGVQPGAIAVDEYTGRAFVLNTMPGSVSVLDTRTGTLLRTVTIAAFPHALAIDTRHGRVFVAGGAGVSVLDAGSGALRSTIMLAEDATAVAVDARTGRAFIALVGAFDQHERPLGSGHVAILDARTGTILHTVSVGVGPEAIAVDDRAGRAYVANAGGTMPRADPWAWVPSWLRHMLPLPPRPTAQTVPGSVSVLDATR